MNRYVLGLLGAFALIALPQPAVADDLVLDGYAAREYGRTLPPIGFVRFCEEHPEECRKYSDSERAEPHRLVTTPEQWILLHQVNEYVNRKVAPMSDLEQYGESERWTYPEMAGDCEDYLLLKKRSLEELGFPRRALRITVVLDEKNEGHAVLMVITDDGDLVLDNRRNEVMRWKETNYTYLKRQGTADPTRWVALQKAPPTVSTAGN